MSWPVKKNKTVFGSGCFYVSGSACAVFVHCFTDRGGPACFFRHFFSEWRQRAYRGEFIFKSIHTTEDEYVHTRFPVNSAALVDDECKDKEHVGGYRPRYSILALYCATHGCLQQQCDVKGFVRKGKLWRQIRFVLLCQGRLCGISSLAFPCMHSRRMIERVLFFKFNFIYLYWNQIFNHFLQQPQWIFF